jgi:hypothetical protein
LSVGAYYYTGSWWWGFIVFAMYIVIRVILNIIIEEFT